MNVAFVALVFVLLSAIAAFVYIHLRHAALTALVMSAALVSGLMLGLAPFPFGRVENGLDAFVFALVAAQSIAAATLRQICGGASPREAARRACREVAQALPAPVAIVMAAVAAVAVQPRMGSSGVAAAAAILAGCGCAFGAGWSGGFLRYGEDDVARFNRLRERRAIRIAGMAFVVEKRWSFSLSGVALVLAAIAFFGARPIHFHRDTTLSVWIYLPLLAAAAFAGFTLIVRDWRLAVAATLTLALIFAWAFWAASRDWRPMDTLTALWLGVVLSIAALPLAVFCKFVRRAMREGDDPAAALLGASTENAPSAIFIGIPASIVLVPFAALGITWPSEMMLSSIVAPLFFCGFAGALGTLLPRYRSVEDVFGKR